MLVLVLTTTIYKSYQLDGASGGALVALLSVEEKTLASLGGPCGNVVSDLSGLLVLQVGSELLLGNSLGTEPEM